LERCNAERRKMMRKWAGYFNKLRAVKKVEALRQQSSAA
jgi:hypothetical protein